MILKNRIDSSSFVDISNGITSIVAGDYSMSSMSDKGNFINGPLSISSSFDKIRMGGIFKFNTLMASTMPSNVITPVPTLEIDVPAKEVSGLLLVTSMILSTAAG